jgi:hypothetical protein
MHVIHASQRPQRTTPKRQDGGAPRVVDDPAQRAVEIRNDQQWSPLQMMCRSFNGRPDRDGF